MKSQGTLLVVEDDEAVRKGIEAALRAMNFEVRSLATGHDAVQTAEEYRFDVVLLDIAMPGMDGIEVCRELRRVQPKVGILMVTVYDEGEMAIRALDAGADDYVTKPFHAGELGARIRALIRRSQRAEMSGPRVITIGEIELDTLKRHVRRSGEPVHLTPKEFKLLCYLMLNAGFPIRHARLLAAVWGSEYETEVEYLRTFVRQLRKKLRDDQGAPRYLLTVSHFGYRFREPL